MDRWRWFQNNVADHVECAVQGRVEMPQIRRTDGTETVRQMSENCIRDYFAILRDCVLLIGPSLIRLRVPSRDKRLRRCENQDLPPAVGHVRRVENPVSEKLVQVTPAQAGEVMSRVLGCW
jgi:hypothetical protein